MAVALLFCAVAWIFSSMLAFPERFPCERPDQKELYVYCGPPSDIGLEYTDVEFSAADGTALRGWFVPAPSRRAVLFSHGRSAGRWMASKYLRALHAAGLNVLTFDFRAHGASAGDFSSLGFHERTDLFAALDYLERQRGMRSIGIAGFSMGAAAGILAMAEDQRVRAGLFESPFANASDQVADGARAGFGLPRFPLVPIVMRLYALRGGMDLARMNPENAVRTIAPRPVFIIHGEEDPAIAIEHGRRVFAAAGEPKQSWWVRGGHHVDSWNMDREQSERLTVEFFTKNL